jgi:cysteine synthase
MRRTVSNPSSWILWKLFIEIFVRVRHIRDSFDSMKINDLYRAVSGISRSRPNTRTELHAALRRALSSPSVQECIEWELPPVEDISGPLELTRGQVLAVRYDSLAGGIGLKKPVVSALLVRQVLLQPPAFPLISGIVDGGNVNTGLALGHFAKRFKLKARLVLSRHFPEDVRRYIEEASDGRLETIVAPPSHLGREREFYSFLVSLIRERLLPNFIPLWHAKYGGVVLRSLGEELARQIPKPPDYIVLCIGAGATLEGLALPIQKHFAGKSRIIATEHLACPLIDLGPKKIFNVSADFREVYSTEWLREPPGGIPHAVLGPHYDEVNPFIKSGSLHRIESVARYAEDQWKQMASFCKKRSLSIGNSSAVNLLVARALAMRGKSVLTFIYEPCREYYNYKAKYATSGPEERRSRPIPNESLQFGSVIESRAS